jgi:hypothetical protein
MPSKVAPKSNKPAAKSASKSTEVSSGAAIVVAKPTIVKGNGTHDNVYDDAVKEVVALSENDTYARKVDNGPLSEARGKDTWRLHAQLRAVDQVNGNMTRETSAIKTALSTLDEHLHTDTVAITELVERHGSTIASAVSSSRSSITSSVSGAQTSLTEAIKGAQTSLSKAISSTKGELDSAVTEAQTVITNTVEQSTENIAGQISKFSAAVSKNFSELAKATAGSEENLRAQTQSFSKAMEELLNTLQNNFEKQILEFRDESTRLIDKRFNQSDVAFAAVRADQEVIKALLTDIIKDRLGRAEPRVR